VAHWLHAWLQVPLRSEEAIVLLSNAYDKRCHNYEMGFNSTIGLKTSLLLVRVLTWRHNLPPSLRQLTDF
jgi:hypothetical protein